MPIEPTISEQNLKHSLKKFFIAQLVTGKSIEVTFFDRFLEKPNRDSTAWIAAVLGPGFNAQFSSRTLDMICCTRGDNEGGALSALVDAITEVLEPEIIPFFNTDDEEIGTILVSRLSPGREGEAPDGTKIKIFSCLLRWVASV